MRLQGRSVRGHNKNTSALARLHFQHLQWAPRFHRTLNFIAACFSVGHAWRYLEVLLCGTFVFSCGCKSDSPRCFPDSNLPVLLGGRCQPFRHHVLPFCVGLPHARSLPPADFHFVGMKAALYGDIMGHSDFELNLRPPGR